MESAISPPSIDDLVARLPAFCLSHGIARQEVFGSVATGRALPGSDLDLLVTFQPGVEPGLDFFVMGDELEQLLGCRVDLLTRRSVERSDNPIRRRSILESTREIYGALTERVPARHPAFRRSDSNLY
jgi:predicted nucleotidyltransferase